MITAADLPPDAVLQQRRQFTTTDPDEALAFIARMYAAELAASAPFRRPSPLNISQISAGGVSSVDVTLPQGVTLRLAGTEDLSISHLVAGTKQSERGKDVERYRAGEISLGAWPGGDCVVRCSRLRVQVMTIPAAALRQAVGSLPGDNVAPLRFPSLAPASPVAQQQWKRVAKFAHGVLDDDQTAVSPLIIGSIGRLLANTALAVFPNNLVPEHGLTGRAATPDTVRRAEEFLHANAGNDIGLADIAVVCHVSPRALQYAFARHHQMSPMRYLRRLRLARVHEELATADPAAGLTVTAVAARWGFARPSRFAADYISAYGVHPQKTLHTGSGTAGAAGPC